jgi:hypothetical protein
MAYSSAAIEIIGNNLPDTALSGLLDMATARCRGWLPLAAHVTLDRLTRQLFIIMFTVAVLLLRGLGHELITTCDHFMGTRERL